MKDIELIAKEVLQVEAQALLDSMDSMDFEELENIVECVLKSRGSLVVSGVGKSGLVGAKISATLSSTGTPSFFMHPTEAIHGDLGMLKGEDIILAISYSGESDELRAILPHIKERGNKIITMTKDKNSSISKIGDFFLPIKIQKEACPLNIAPTTSTTLTLAMGDVLSVCLMKKRGFNPKDFASFHPGGSLGKRLFVKISDLMQTQNLPIITPQTSLKEAIIKMSESRLGNAIIAQNNKPIAILSDGDLRRAMMREDFDINALASVYATKNPKICNDENTLAIDVLNILEQNKIQMLIVTDKEENIKGIIHIHMLISAGIK